MSAPLTKQNRQQIESANIQDMIALLKEYETMCLTKNDFTSADEAKNKIEFLKSQDLILRREKIESEDKQNIQHVSKQGDEEIRMFQDYWEQHLQELIEKLKEIQADLENQQERELVLIVEKLEKEEIPKIKYSSQVLDLRKYLKSLIKFKNYKQAEIVKNKLCLKEKEEEQKWVQKNELKKKAKIQAIKKKQQSQLKVLRIKAEAAFNQKIKERDQKFDILLKKNRKRRIESGKISRQRLKTKTALLNESKTFHSVSKY